MQAFYLGFDGGGTKTECALLDDTGDVLARAHAGPSNPLRVGFEAAGAALRDSASAALSHAQVTPQQVRALCAGLAGAGRPGVARRMLVFLAEVFPTVLAHVTTDFEVALEAAAGPGPGVVLIAGTGSSAFGRNAAGETARAGGYGPWVGDEGSAFDIGRRGVARAALARDLLAAPTRLVQAIPAALGADWDAITERIARNADEVFPRVFPVVVEAAEGGDAAAREILAAAASGLSRIARGVIERLRLEESEFPLVKSGGVFGRSALLEAALDADLRAAAPRARIELLRLSPAVGAARLAMRLAAGSAGAAAAKRGDDVTG